MAWKWIPGTRNEQYGVYFPQLFAKQFVSIPMRSCLLIFSLIFFSLSLTTLGQSETGKMTISLTNLRNNKGHALVSLFRDGVGYPDQPAKAFRKEKLVITDRKVTLHLEGIPAGSYAIAILHDENDDLRMNTNWIGIPKEGYGFSNNVMGTLGPPSIQKASFRFEPGNPATIVIKARY